MNTNAGAKKPEWWRELAKTIGQNGHVIFSLDGLKDTTICIDKMLIGIYVWILLKHLLMLAEEQDGII